MSYAADQPVERRAGGPINARWMVVLFALLLLVPVAAQVFGIGTGSGENRTLAPFPRITRLKEIKDLPRLADAYINDRFGLRSQLVLANSLLRFRAGLSSNKHVVVGSGGWLFYAAEKIMEQHTGANIFFPAELDRWVRQMEANRDWFEQRGIAFLMVIAPDKNTIYPEKLPDYPLPNGAATRMDQLVARLRSSTLPVVDPRAALIEAKAKGVQVYFEGDSHWTQRGALVAYSLIMERLRDRFPGVPALSLADYDMVRSTRPTADLTAMLGLQNDLAYAIERLEPKVPHRTVPPVTTMRPGWPWRIVENRNDLANRPRLLVMGDSFTDYVLGPDFLYETFRDPVWTHHNLGTFDLDLVNEVKPDIVIFQLAERYLRSPLGSPIGVDAPPAVR